MVTHDCKLCGKMILGTLDTYGSLVITDVYLDTRQSKNRRKVHICNKCLKKAGLL